MPPKAKITKEDIIAASIDIVRENGADALNARSVAKKLNCSTQPIFSNYSSMDELKADVIDYANNIHNEYLERAIQDNNYAPYIYKASGIYYIEFAKEERELFKLLFMRDRSKEKIKDEKEEIEWIIKIISADTGLSLDEAYMFHLQMWIYVHGIAVMFATSYLDWDWQTIDKMLTDAYMGLKYRYLSKGEDS